jgi:proline dehydrogenase
MVNAIPGHLVRTFASPYVAGDSLEKALETADRFHKEHGLHSTMDVLGEAEETREKVTEALQVYIKTLDAIASRPYCTLSAKPSQLGYYIDPGFCRENLEQLAQICQERKIGLTVDMEDVDLTEFTVQTYSELKPKYSVLGTVLQSRLHRTEKDVDRLAGLQAHIRLCIGIYPVTPEHGLQKKRDMKERLLMLLRKLLDGGHYVCVATHDEAYIRKSLAVFDELKVPKDRREFQMLMGVPRSSIQKELVDRGETVRLYVPYATHWDDALAYLRRRMINNPHMAGLVLKNLFSRS